MNGEERRHRHVYQQEDRDRRKALRASGEETSHTFMVRTKNPGGFVPSALFLALAELAHSHGNGTLRVTTRHGFQLHGVPKSNLKDAIATINANLGSTLGACGDINRNVMAPAAPSTSKAYVIARETAHAIAELLTPRTSAYYEIWQDGELAHTSEVSEDPLYRDTYLPRKFKIAVAAPGDNSVDILTNDVGVVPVLSAVDVLLGFDLYVGGGLGMTHRKPDTFPRLADAFGFAEPDELLSFVRAIVEVQRDYGDRTNRKHARLNTRSQIWGCPGSEPRSNATQAVRSARSASYRRGSSATISAGASRAMAASPWDFRSRTVASKTTRPRGHSRRFATS